MTILINEKTTKNMALATAFVRMRDDVNLRTEIYTPGEQTLGPVLLIRTPYSEPMQRSLPIAPAVAAGFTVVIQYCRGTYGSEGSLKAFESEREDGLDTFEWIRKQEWCDGNIVMFGQSYLGMTQNAVAGSRPDGLRGMVQSVTTHSYRDGLAFQQGAFQLGQGLGWHLLKVGQTLADYSAAGRTDHFPQRQAFMELLSKTDEAYRVLPSSNLPAITEVLPSWNKWIESESNPEYWKSFSFTDQRTKTQVPVLHIGGWFDLFLSGTIDNYVTISNGAEQEEIRSQQHLIIGPWTHTDQTGNAGELLFASGGAAAIGLEQQQINFLKASIAGERSNLPPVQLYIMGSNIWRTEQEWPLARTEWQEWQLTEHRELVSNEYSADSALLEFKNDPTNPVPTIGGRTLMPGGIDGGMHFQPGTRDQRILDDRTDILSFTSNPLDTDLEVTGPVNATLTVSTSADDADFAVRLIDVYPDGRAMGVTEGILRLRYREGMDEQLPVVPDQPYTVTVSLVATGQLFKRGHRLRVDISGSNFPCFDRNLGTGKPIKENSSTDMREFSQSLHFGPSCPMSITLPIIPISN